MECLRYKAFYKYADTGTVEIEPTLSYKGLHPSVLLLTIPKETSRFSQYLGSAVRLHPSLHGVYFEKKELRTLANDMLTLEQIMKSKVKYKKRFKVKVFSYDDEFMEEDDVSPSERERIDYDEVALSWPAPKYYGGEQYMTLQSFPNKVRVQAEVETCIPRQFVKPLANRIKKIII